MGRNRSRGDLPRRAAPSNVESAAAEVQAPDWLTEIDVALIGQPNLTGLGLVGTYMPSLRAPTEKLTKTTSPGVRGTGGLLVHF